MIVVDASALLAIYFREPERDRFIEALRAAEAREISPVNLWEALVRAQSADGDPGASELENLLTNLAIDVAGRDGETARIAADAFSRYGKRTPAKLNLGDCFAYALAKQRKARLLFTGDDFVSTDVEPV